MADAANLFGWYCELVHEASGTVLNTVLIHADEGKPLEGQEGKPAGWTWRATPLFTSDRKAWTVRPAWTQGRDGNPKRCGWHLMNGSEWAQTFARKGDAQKEADAKNAGVA